MLNGRRSAEFMQQLQGGRTAFEVVYVPDFTPVVTPKMVQAGIGVLERKITAQLEYTIGNPRFAYHESRSSGSLIDSIRVSNTFFRDNATRFFANVFFDGYHERKGGNIRQGEKAAYLNFGTGQHSNSGLEFRRRYFGSKIQGWRGGKRFRKHYAKGWASTGSTKRTNFTQRAYSAARAPVMAAMKAVLERELRLENSPG